MNFSAYLAFLIACFITMYLDSNSNFRYFNPNECQDPKGKFNLTMEWRTTLNPGEKYGDLMFNYVGSLACEFLNDIYMSV